MTRGTKNYSRTEGCICEQFVYLPELALHTNSSDMNELGVIRGKKDNLKGGERAWKIQNLKTEFIIF